VRRPAHAWPTPHDDAQPGGRRAGFGAGAGGHRAQKASRSQRRRRSPVTMASASSESCTRTERPCQGPCQPNDVNTLRQPSHAQCPRLRSFSAVPHGAGPMRDLWRLEHDSASRSPSPSQGVIERGAHRVGGIRTGLMQDTAPLTAILTPAGSIRVFHGGRVLASGIRVPTGHEQHMTDDRDRQRRGSCDVVRRHPRRK
jgi:hypothetical protein